MSEVWVVCGPTWRLPVVIEKWHDTLGEISFEPPVPMLARQKQKVKEVLRDYVFARALKDWIFLRDLRRVAFKAETDDYESLVEWLPEKAYVKIPEFKQNEFIQAYCSSSYALSHDPVVVDAIWVSILKFGLHWLVNEEREIDFGFAKLVPLCLRKNWGNAAAKWELLQKRRHQILSSDFLNPNVESMDERRVLDYLVSLNVVSYEQESRTVRPCLEIIESEEYRKASRTRELARRRQWKANYFGILIDRLKRQLPAVIECYAHQLKEAAYPSLKTDSINMDRGDGKRTRKFVSCEAEKAAGHWGEDDALFFTSAPAGDPGALRGQDGALPNEVPDLQSPERDVRDPGADVP